MDHNRDGASLSSRIRRDPLVRELAERAFTRASGTGLVLGNQVDLLLDADENYPAWREAIEGARQSIHLEMYIFRADPTGDAFAELLARKAREGVAVRVLYDWLGGVGKTPGAFWRRLRDAGVEVRCFNPARLSQPLGWIRRDHRKAIVVDGAIAFVSGLCIGRDWEGHPELGVEPWRDTGVAIRGPAVADVARACAHAWAEADGHASPPAASPPPDVAGDTAVRVVASTPATTGHLRLDLLWAALAQERLWITDAYFVGTAPYRGALCAAAAAGVDVRILVPSASDIRAVALITRAQYRPLLDAGVRVFEWNGAMIHAKSASVDGRWARVGSTNLNVASWLGNWELDVCVEDSGFTAALEAAFERDLEGATEVVLDERRKARRRAERVPPAKRTRVAPGSATRAAAAALEVGGVLGAAVTSRTAGESERPALRALGVGLLAVAAVALLAPQLVAFPIGIAAAWIGVSLFAQSRPRSRGN